MEQQVENKEFGSDSYDEWMCNDDGYSWLFVTCYNILQRSLYEFAYANKKNSLLRVKILVFLVRIVHLAIHRIWQTFISYICINSNSFVGQNETSSSFLLGFFGMVDEQIFIIITSKSMDKYMITQAEQTTIFRKRIYDFA